MSDAKAPAPNEPVDPSDRGHLLTERRLTAAADLDRCSVAECLAVINAEDRKVADAVAAAMPALTGLVEAVVGGMSRGGRLVYLGAGTSGRLGVLDASECPPTFQTEPGEVVGLIAGGDGALRRSSEGMEDDPDGAVEALDGLSIDDRDTVVGIAAGGTTPYVLGGLRHAGSRGAVTGLIACVSLDDVARRLGLGDAHQLADHRVELLVGPEVVTGSTRMKAGTATKLALNMISTTAMIRRGKVWGNLMVDLRASNAKLRDRALRIVMGQTELSRAEAEALLDAAGGGVKAALVMHGRGVDAASAGRLLAEAGGRLGEVLGRPKG